MQIPRGPEDRFCPFWRQKMSKVCHTCPMWTLLRGKNPQTEEMIDRWDCAIAHTPMLMLEVAQANLQNRASTDKVATEVRNSAAAVAAEVKKFHDKMVDMNLKTLRLEGGRGQILLGDDYNNGGLP